MLDETIILKCPPDALSLPTISSLLGIFCFAHFELTPPTVVPLHFQGPPFPSALSAIAVSPPLSLDVFLPPPDLCVVQGGPWRNRERWRLGSRPRPIEIRCRRSWEEPRSRWLREEVESQVRSCSGKQALGIPSCMDPTIYKGRHRKN